MQLLAKIQADQVQARKDRDVDKAAALTTLYSEAATVGLNDSKRVTTDPEVIAVVKKFIKNLSELIEAVRVNSPELLPKYEAELATYNTYLPTQLTEEDLRSVIGGLIVTQSLSGPKSLGLVMKHLNSRHEGQFDGKLASSVARELLV